MIEIKQQSSRNIWAQFKKQNALSNLRNNLLYGHKNPNLNFLGGNPFASFGGGWTFEEHFTDDQTTLDARWLQTGTLCQAEASTDNFVWTGLRVATNHAMSHSPIAVSDTAWVLRVMIDPIALTAGTYSSNFGFGMRSVSSATGAVSGTPDSLMMAIGTRGGESAKWYFEGDNGTPWASPQIGSNLFTNVPPLDPKWYEILRLTATTATAKVFDDAFITLLEQKAGVTISSSIIDTDYITFQNDNNGDIGGTFNGTGDDVQFANDVTVAP